MPREKTVVIGGGLAGLVISILLSRAGFDVSLVEKKLYPFHRVCGEYISREVYPFFKSIGIDLQELSPAQISRLAISSVSGKLFSCNLDLGGLGISRYVLDDFLYRKARALGVNFELGHKVNNTDFRDGLFNTVLSDGREIESDFVIGAYGKRSNLDRSRSFFYRRSPYLGVKYHIRTDFPDDLIQLDNFEGGYCGTVKIEGDRYNLCYLSANKHLSRLGSIQALEREVLFRNPFLKAIFTKSEFLLDKPEVINEISFEKKSLIEGHVLYCGDAAGMISPLCGNGMAMAVHSAKILSDTLVESYRLRREVLEAQYIKRWRDQFSKRLYTGRIAQRFFGAGFVSELTVSGLKNIGALSNLIIRETHGTPF
ncbi:NAD(P)/FAD-dependent oxidoreductase [Desertivirga xinjiangensis]|uniref:NAD(P)/FAD-dependent oxidoreductase n=1 Tax=Desertivirga xinjiangensis TaxID=539206 RepID=UPI00210AA87D|nr:NAD(P)/FAD-dependent oxidoreductase [Pedobacter xinjiangensis]